MTGIKTPTSSEEHSWAADKEESGLTGGTAFSHTDKEAAVAARQIIGRLETNR